MCRETVYATSCLTSRIKEIDHSVSVRQDVHVPSSGGNPGRVWSIDWQYSTNPLASLVRLNVGRCGGGAVISALARRLPLLVATCACEPRSRPPTSTRQEGRKEVADSRWAASKRKIVQPNLVYVLPGGPASPTVPSSLQIITFYHLAHWQRQKYSVGAIAQGAKVPNGVQRQIPLGGVVDEVIQKLKQFADTVYRFLRQKRSKFKNFAQFTSWFLTVCLTLGGG